ncbi:MAG: polyribonucleotide nucleotidyltransferase [Deltaproteobacteria bacterium]|nr:polyribonucleotide nucleotidyltransferase [Deltaproteobacteria bacterium]MBW1977044.1 polyribonucleotide nucleotidyltransferase [Deltaproteobacteria bacterium]MBW2045064.1 polyribonucleotide nucleotidyltransferase [Deltaproteobacteria bacterium]MBW2300566.1 polyribonucleotide nucleotidyltransferase [Deltaproteobacteria bacterium]
MIKGCTRKINGQSLYIETGRVAKQANGAAVITMGETVVLVTAVASEEIREGVDFLPLTVEYQEMSYAGGRIPGNYFRRDMGRPSEKETLTSRLIDRPLRPLFPDNYAYETQIIATVLSTDKENEADVLAVLGASAALEVSDIPFMGPIAAVRVGRVDGKFVANPTRSMQLSSDINLIVAGNWSGVVMVEGGGEFVSESDIIEAIFFGYEALKPLLEMQEEIRKDAGKPKREVPPAPRDEELEGKIQQIARPLLQEILNMKDKLERQKKRKDTIARVMESLSEEYEDREAEVREIIYDQEKNMVRRMVLEEGRRIDGRSFTEVRPIECMVGVLPRVHGSALFTRGETQAMVLTTLGTELDEQRIETIYGSKFRHFIFHYNFPPYSVGEARRITGPGRREIGHGALARRALLPVIPSKDEFQYTLRVVSEILESNGSSSMASVCGGSLSLMDAGVPVKDAVGGVAMGLVSDGKKTVVLTDINGDEDHYGDMDFKVTGTREGVTALQMDIKIEGVTKEIMQEALEQAKEARLFILDRMHEAIPKPRSQISEYAPVVSTLQIKPEKVRILIGPGGKVIRDICNRTDSRIDVDDSGKVIIVSPDAETAKMATDMVAKIVQEAEVGKVYLGKVRKIMDFGAFVEIFPGTDGLVHISQLDKERVNKVTDVLKEGDEVLVKVLEVDKNGRISLSRKAVLGESREDV